MDLGVVPESPLGSQSSSRVGACTFKFLPICGSSVTLPLACIKGSAAFPRGFPMSLSHEDFPQGCPTCHRGVVDPRLKSRGSAGKTGFPGIDRDIWGTRNGGTTLEFLYPFLWRGPPLEMRLERRECFPDHAGKGSLLSSYEVETVLL